MHKQILILSNILLILFLAGFINLVTGWLTKFSMWSFKVMKQLLVLLISYSVKYISSFWILDTFFVCNILYSFRCFFISCSSILSNVWAGFAYFMSSLFIISLFLLLLFYMLQILHCPGGDCIIINLLLVYTCLRFCLLA